MVECMSTPEMSYFLSLIMEKVPIEYLEDGSIVIHAKNGTIIVWEYVKESMQWCMKP